MKVERYFVPMFSILFQYPLMLICLLKPNILVSINSPLLFLDYRTHPHTHTHIYIYIYNKNTYLTLIFTHHY